MRGVRGKKKKEKAKKTTPKQTNSRSVKKEDEEMQPVEETIGKQVDPCSPWRSMVEQIIFPLHPGEHPTPEQGDAQRRL